MSSSGSVKLRYKKCLVIWGDAEVLRRPVESAQYISNLYTERLVQAGIEPSVGSRGDSYDNALAETINGLYKAELIHHLAPWKTKDALELATLDEWLGSTTTDCSGRSA